MIRTALPWGMVAVGLGIAAWLFGLRGAALSPGMTIERRLTLITADRDDLACALPHPVDEYHCRFVDPALPPERSSDASRVLQPFVSLEGQILLIPDLFAQPSLDRRYRDEPPIGRPRDALQRFTAHCTLELRDRVDRIAVRFGSDTAFRVLPFAWVARAISCRIPGAR